MSSRVTWVGHVSGERARQVWAAADAFVLPSYSEGFSMAILEALACRLPSLITTACHFPELAAADGGIVVEPTVEGVTRRAPRPARTLDRPSAATLGRDGRALVERTVHLGPAGRRLAEVYRWLAGGGPRPRRTSVLSAGDALT